MEGLADTIRSVLIFSGLSREDVAKVLGKMEEISFEADATIFSQGEQGDAFYLIQSGAVQVLLESGSDKSEVVAILGPRDWFGEMALLTGEPRSATIRTIKSTSLWRLRREDWDELIEKHPTWLLQLSATLSKRTLAQRRTEIARSKREEPPEVLVTVGLLHEERVRLVTEAEDLR